MQRAAAWLIWPRGLAGRGMSELFSFGAWVRRRRRALDLTREELAPRLGCAVVTLRRIEGDERRPSKELAARLADCLEIPAEERGAFLRAARGELAVDQLAPPAQLQRQRPTEADEPPSALAADAQPLPSGTVTFLFTDIEGSTRLWETSASAMPDVLARQSAILRSAIAAHRGVIFKSLGDGFCAAFGDAPAALHAALDAQRALYGEDWGAIGRLLVRMAVHAGTAVPQGDDYFGPPLNRVARLLNAAHGGQILLSGTTFDLVHERLPAGVALRDLGTHQLKDLSRPERFFQVVVPDLPAEFPPLRSLAHTRTNLPLQLTSLVGRAREVTQVSRLLRRVDVRLVTLTGPGGIGKTRLAQHIAADLLDAFVDGVIFVDLAPISEPAQLESVIVEVLGLTELSGQPLREQLATFLRDRQLLLLLDNFEQVVAAAPLVVELLQIAPQLKVLATSRALLRVSGEHEFAVQPLGLPDPERPTPVEQLHRYPAVALFVERASAVRPNVHPSHTVVEICRRLDGLPLAIELAAARVRLFSPETLLVRLERRLPLLTGGPRDLPERQQTLRTTIDWSYDLLSRHEQAFFVELGVFVGGWTLEAAQAICMHADDLGSTVEDVLQSLLEQNLVRLAEGPDRAPRFTMLETIREYAGEKLAARGEAGTVRKRHAEYYTPIAEALYSNPEGLLKTVALEYGNLQAALRWAVEQPEPALALRLVDGLGWFCLRAGLWSEAQQWLQWVLAQPVGREHTLVRAGALVVQGQLFDRQGDASRAQALLEEGLALFRELRGDKTSIMYALLSLGVVLREQGNSGQASACFEELIAIGREVGEPGYVAWGQLCLAVVAVAREEAGQARALLAESLPQFEGEGNSAGIGWALNTLGHVEQLEGNYGRAVELQRESLRRLTDVQQEGAVWALESLGELALAQGELLEARAYFAEGLRLARELGFRHGVAWCLASLGSALVIDGQAERGAQLWGAAEALRETIHARPAPASRANYEQAVARARIQLSPSMLAKHLDAGRACGWRQAAESECTTAP